MRAGSSPWLRHGSVALTFAQAMLPARGRGKAGRGVPVSAPATFPARIGVLALVWAALLCPPQCWPYSSPELNSRLSAIRIPSLELRSRLSVGLNTSPEGIRGSFEALCGFSWEPLGPSSAPLGPLLDVLGAPLGHIGRSNFLTFKTERRRERHNHSEEYVATHPTLAEKSEGVGAVRVPKHCPQLRPPRVAPTCGPHVWSPCVAPMCGPVVPTCGPKFVPQVCVCGYW